MADEPKVWKMMTFRERYKHVLKCITVEPMLACYIIPSVLAGLATQNLNLEKACRVNMNYGDIVCDALSRRETANYTMEEKTIQQMVAAMAGWKTVLQSALPCMLILFWGSWSDRHGRRKPCMLIPIIGEFISAIGLILCTYFPVPMEVAGITEALFPGLTGGWFTMLMGIFSYVADVTTEEERTLRIGVVNLFFSLGVPIGMAFSGILLKKIGFYGVFSISASLYLVAFVYGVFLVKEPKQRTVEEKSIVKKGLLEDFFNKEHVVETFRVAFKKGHNQRRTRVIMLMVVVMVVIGPLHGEMSVMYLFTRFRFNWSEVEFSFYSTYSMLTSLVGTMFSVGVFSHMLKIDDSLIGVMSSLSKIFSSFVYAFASVDWHLYLGAVVEILNGTSFIAMRSIASKLVTSDELGKVNSLFGVAEALMPLAYAPMYTSLYSATLNTLPGAFFLLGGALTTPAVFIFLWMYRISKQDQKLKNIEQNEKEMKKTKELQLSGKSDSELGNGGFGTISANLEAKLDGAHPTRMGSMRKRGIVNSSYIKDDDQPTASNGDTIQEEFVDIVKELPALHLEHCKL